MHGVASGKVAREDFDLHYSIEGQNGPLLVVLAAGPGSDPRYMKPIVDQLSASFRCVLLEQRGTGRAMLRTYNPTTTNFSLYLEDLENLRQHLGQERIILLGHSW
jgi:proline iminopeptidase